MSAWATFPVTYAARAHHYWETTRIIFMTS